MTTFTIDTDARYTVAGWPGVAVYVRGWEQRTEPTMVLCENEDGEEWEEEDWSETETVDDVGGMIRVTMVGDDAVHLVDPDDLTEISDDDYCSGCGQVGCGWC